MKKLIALISFLLTVSCLFAACGSNASTNFDEEPAPEQTNTPQITYPTEDALQTGYPTENVRPSVCNHYWQEANCITPMTCVYCGMTQGTVGEHMYIDPTGELVGTERVQDYPTCVETGISVGACLVCGM